MTNGSDTALEEQIRNTLHEHASAFHPIAPGMSDDGPGIRRAIPTSGRRPRVTVIALALSVTGLVILGAWIAVRPTTSQVEKVDTKPFAGPHNAGARISLTEVPTPPGVEAAMAANGSILGPRSSLVTVRFGAGPLLAISSESSGKRLRSCTAELDLSSRYRFRTRICGGGAARDAPVVQNFDAQNHTLMYVTWINVPRSTAYTTFVSDETRAWQRPLERINVFPVDGHPTNARLSAFARDGRLLATTALVQ